MITKHCFQTSEAFFLLRTHTVLFGYHSKWRYVIVNVCIRFILLSASEKWKGKKPMLRSFLRPALTQKFRPGSWQARNTQKLTPHNSLLSATRCVWMEEKNSHENAEVEAIVNVHCHISARLCCCRWESGWQSGCHRNDMMGFYVISYLMPFAVDTHSEGMCIKILLSNYFISMLGMECE